MSESRKQPGRIAGSAAALRREKGQALKLQESRRCEKRFSGR